MDVANGEPVVTGRMEPGNWLVVAKADAVSGVVSEVAVQPSLGEYLPSRRVGVMAGDAWSRRGERRLLGSADRGVKLALACGGVPSRDHGAGQVRPVAVDDGPHLDQHELARLDPPILGAWVEPGFDRCCDLGLGAARLGQLFESTQAE